MKDFYAKMRNGAKVTTMACNPDDTGKAFRKILNEMKRYPPYCFLFSTKFQLQYGICCWPAAFRRIS